MMKEDISWHTEVAQHDWLVYWTKWFGQKKQPKRSDTMDIECNKYKPSLTGWQGSSQQNRYKNHTYLGAFIAL